MANFIPENELRNKRNLLLKDSDWTQLSDSPLTSEQKTAWATYRQTLRDLPANVDLNNLSEDLHEVTWPSKPE